MAEKKSTQDSILDVAQQLLQTRGYNGFSYKDLGQALGIRTASIHYHFPAKTDLGIRLAVRYRERFAAELAAIAAREADPARRIERFGQLFRRTFEIDDRLCLCGMLSAEIATLPDAVAAEVERFFRGTEAWIAGVLTAGRKSGAFSFDGSAQQQARLLLAILEGAMVVARGMRDRPRFADLIARYLAQLAAPTVPANRANPKRSKPRA